MPKLVIQNLKSKEEQEYDLAKDSILFGRTNTSDIELPQKSVSRRHAEITRENSDYFISDLESGNGTRLNDKKIMPHEKSLLRSGDVIRIEDYEIKFLLGGDNGESLEEDTDTDILEIKLIKKMIKALDREDTPSVEILNGIAAGKRFSIPEDKKEMVIGRSESCDIPIMENVLSRTHAKLEQKWGGIVVTDLGSKNGTFVNNEPIQEKLLRDGDRIMLGTIKLLYRNPKEVKVHISHQELTRKKKEAALQEAEKLAKKQLEEEKKAQEAADLEKAQQEEKAKEVEEALEKGPEEEPEGEEGPEKEMPEELPPAPIEKPPELASPAVQEEKTKLSTLEKVLIGIGAAVGMVALIGLIILLLK